MGEGAVAVASYHDACARSRAATADMPLDTWSALPHRAVGTVAQRDGLVHMVEETARDLGHLDVLREMTDGQVGAG